MDGSWRRVRVSRTAPTTKASEMAGRMCVAREPSAAATARAISRKGGFCPCRIASLLPVTLRSGRYAMPPCSKGEALRTQQDISFATTLREHIANYDKRLLQAGARAHVLGCRRQQGSVDDVDDPSPAADPYRPAWPPTTNLRSAPVRSHSFPFNRTHVCALFTMLSPRAAPGCGRRSSGWRPCRTAAAGGPSCW